MSEISVTLIQKTVGLTFNQSTRVVQINVMSNQGGGQGNDGKSAYEIAVENGFIGSEIQWLESLIGDTGLQGPAGNDGAQGPQGPAGNDGAQGPQGPQGPAGNDGAQGPQGPAGNDGPQGPQGPAGNDGSPKVIAEFTTNTILTTVTTEQVLATLPIPANRFVTGKNYQALSMLQRTGNNSTIVLRYRIGTAAIPAVITTEVLLATSNVVSTNNYNPFNRRNIHVESSTSLLVYSPTTAIVEDNAAATNISSLAVTNTAQQYLYITGQLLNASDSITLHNFKLTE